MRGKPVRLAKYLTPVDLMKLLPISRPTFYRWAEAGKFGDLVKRDKHGKKFYYARPEDLPSIKKLIEG